MLYYYLDYTLSGGLIVLAMVILCSVVYIQKPGANGYWQDVYSLKSLNCTSPSHRIMAVYTIHR